jgi:hypothetical protein
VAVIVFLGVAALAWWRVDQIEQVRRLLGDRALRVLPAAAAVEVYRVDPKDYADPTRTPTTPDERVGGYAVTATGPPQGPEFAARLRRLLFDPGTYWFEAAKGCIFQPGVAFRLRDGGDVVEVLLCFSCDELRILTRDAAGNVLHRGDEDFDPARPALVELAREAFPDDPVIRALEP